MYKKFNKKIPLFLLLFLLSFSVFISSTVKAGPQTESLALGILPEMNIFKQRERFEGVAAFLSSQMGIDVKLKMLSYGNVIEKLKNGNVDGAFLGSFTAALAISQLDTEPLVRPINIDNSSTYQGYIITRKDSRIRTVDHMKDKSLALVQETTAGFVFPLAWFRQHGVDDPNTFFSKQVISGSHDRTVALVLNGRADIGAVKSTIYKNMSKWQRRIKAELTVLAISPSVPSNALCINKNVAPEYKQKIKDLLLNMRGYPKGRKALEKLGAKRFVETSLDLYEPVFGLAKEAGLDLEKYGARTPDVKLSN